MRAWLDSVSCISFGRSLEEFKPKTTDSVFSTTTEGSNLPLFLQDQGTFNAPQELLEKVKVSRIFGMDILRSGLGYLHICASAGIIIVSFPPFQYLAMLDTL